MLVLGAAGAADAGPFANLRSGEVLTVQCEERGCWHGKEIEFVFTRIGQVQAEAFECGVRASIETRRRLGSVSLPADETSALDGLFEAFAPPSDAFSTTSVRLRVRLQSPGEADRVEHRTNFLPAAEGGLGGALFALAKRVEAAGAQPGNAEPIWQIPGGAETGAVDAWLREASALQAVAPDYTVEFSHCLDAGPGEPVVGLRLTARKPQLVDEVDWGIPIVGRMAVLPDLRSVLVQAGRQLESIPWLRTWKARSPESRISLHLRGTEAGVSGVARALYLQPLWNQSGLPGRFRWRVTASRLPYDHYRGCSLELLIGDADSRALLVDSHPPRPSGWSAEAPPYELVKTGWDHKDRRRARYAIIQRDGQVEAREAILPMAEW